MNGVERREFDELALTIAGRQGPMIGVLCRPHTKWRASVLIVAGQPQTRVGAHRMFVELARGLARQGVASLRFDVGGWGDSPGDPLAFERSDADIAAAAHRLREAAPDGTPLWACGLCDGASAAVLALPALRAAGVEPAAFCLVNPWVRTDASLGGAMIRTYYARRILDPVFWRRLASGKIPLGNLVGDPLRHLGRRFGVGIRARTTGREAEKADPATGSGAAGADLPTRMIEVLSGYRGEIYTVLSGADLTAGETEALMRTDKRWRKRIDRRDRLLRVADADHTFSDATHWQAVIDWIAAQAARR